MTQQDNYLRRAAQGATLTPPEPTYITHVRETIDYWCDADRQAATRAFVTEMGGYPSDGPSIEAIATTHQRYPEVIWRMICGRSSTKSYPVKSIWLTTPLTN